MRTECDSWEGWNRSFLKWWLRISFLKNQCQLLNEMLTFQVEFFSLKRLKTQLRTNPKDENWSLQEVLRMIPDKSMFKSSLKWEIYYFEEYHDDLNLSHKRSSSYQMERKQMICLLKVRVTLTHPDLLRFFEKLEADQYQAKLSVERCM